MHVCLHIVHLKFKFSPKADCADKLQYKFQISNSEEIYSVARELLQEVSLI